MENATIETVMTYVVAFLSSTAGVTMITIITKAIVNAICTYKSKKVSKLNDADKAQIANEVTNAVLSAISDGVNINAEAMIDRATNKRLDVMDRKFNEFSELLNKIFSVNIAQGKVLVDLKTPSLSARENLANAIGDNHKEIEQIPAASRIKDGVITINDQTIYGTKYFVPTNTSNATANKYGFTFIHEGFKAKLYPKTQGYAPDIGKSDNRFENIYADYVYASERLSGTKLQRWNTSTLIEIPSVNGTMMVAPSTWSSGTSGSVTLTESGTYQVYAVDKEIHIDFGAIYVDLTTEARKSTRVDMSLSYVLIVGSGGSITINKIDTQSLTEETQTIPIYYRRIGI